MQNLFYRLTSSLICTSLFLTSSLSFATPNDTRVKSAASLIAHNARSIHQLMMFATLAGATEESLRAVKKDIQEKTGRISVPKLEIVNNEYVANGTPTGIHITSYSPMKITYQSKTWTADRSKNFSENYFSMTKFLQPTKTTGILEMIIPSAHAITDKEKMWIIGGLWAGAAAVATAMNEGAGAGIAALGALFIIGVFFGPKKGEKEETTPESIKTPLVTCDKDGVKATLNGRTLSIRHTLYGGTRTLVLDTKGVAPDQTLSPELEKLSKELLACKNADDAKKISDELGKAVEMVNKISAKKENAKDAAPNAEELSDDAA